MKDKASSRNNELVAVCMQMPRHGLILDSEPGGGALLSGEPFLDWKFRRADNVAEAARLCAENDVLVGLIRLTSRHRNQFVDIEALTSQGGTEWLAIADPDLMQDGAFRALVLRCFHDYHTHPVDPGRLRVTLGHAYGRAVMRRELAGAASATGRYGMIGRSDAMYDLYRFIDKVVRVDAPVLIGGESGTGKELVARAIHGHSTRAGGPFVEVNCGAIPPNLIQSQLFGHERGAFTDAQQRKIGSIEAASGGVLFLDEIGDLPLELQANLLRFLQEKTITRLGSTQRIHVDVRVIAATHVDLSEAVRAGRFREDLFFRLNVLRIRVPPVRERGEDVELLAQSLFHQFAPMRGPQVTGFSSQALKAMRDHSWPGNVRELINRVQHAMVMSENRLLGASDLDLAPPGLPPSSLTLDDARASAERVIVVESLRKNENNISRAARQLGVSRVTLYRMINKFNIIL